MPSATQQGRRLLHVERKVVGADFRQPAGGAHAAKSQGWVGSCDQYQVVVRKVLDKEVDLFAAFGRADDLKVVDEDRDVARECSNCVHDSRQYSCQHVVAARSDKARYIAGD